MHAATAQPRLSAPRFRVGNLMREHGAEYEHLRPTTPRQRRVIEKLSACRTQELGGYVASCDTCDYRRVVYNPCRDRHCPSCEGQAAKEWLEALQDRILPCRYFHVVFTLPAQLRWLAFQNGALVYGLLLRCAGETLAEVASQPRYLGAQLGVTAVLHTWRRDLQLHPHVHCLVTGGGLSPEGDRWIRSFGERYLAPNRLLAARFRDKLLRRLSRAHAQGSLRFASGCEHLQEPDEFARLRRELTQTSWLVYSKAAFNDLHHLLRYLGRYTHRVGISDRRLLEVDEDEVTFATKNGGTTTVSVFDFLARFLLHVLPHRFVKIRHYGLFASPARVRLEKARVILAGNADAENPTKDPDLDAPEPESVPCPHCFFGKLVFEELIFPTRPPPPDT